MRRDFDGCMDRRVREIFFLVYGELSVFFPGNHSVHRVGPEASPADPWTRRPFSMKRTADSPSLFARSIRTDLKPCPRV